MLNNDETATVPLNELCAICHINPLKYTCPRCGIHTCSLPCVQKHKRRAQCSGVRNPAAYKKRRDLETPSSIDQDFNFITGVERSVQRADDQLLERGSDLIPAGIRRPFEPRKTRFDEAAREAGVTVKRAPSGLSRAKENRSRWDGQHKCISWTVEFISSDQTRVIRQVLSNRTLIQAYVARSVEGLRKNRKRKASDGAKGDPQIPQVMKLDRPGESVDTPLGVEGADKSQAQVYFYFYRPNVPSRLKCLVPLSEDDTLGDVLKSRTILEFPTIYVLPEKPSEIAEPFILEQTYLAQRGSDVPVSLPAYVPSAFEEGEISESPSHVDETKLLEVLQKDSNG